MKSPIWLLCGIVLCFLGGFAVGDTDAHLEKDILDLVNEIQAEHLQTGVEHQQTGEKIKRLKALAEKLNVPQPEPDPCPDCPDCPDCDDDDDDPPPLPPVDGLYDLTLRSGKECTFVTPAPADLEVVAHPRFLIPGRREDLQRKLTDDDHATLRKTSREYTYNALLYAMNGDVAAGIEAKEWVLAQPKELQNTHGAGTIYHELLVYDWCHDLFTAAERDQLFQDLCTRIGIIAPEPGSAEFGIVDERWQHQHKGDGFPPGVRFGNDHGDPTQSHGFIYRGLFALAFYGDGVRDEFCEYIYGTMLDSSDARIHSFYDPVHGGLVDSHNQRALDSGGIQSGWNHDRVMDGYEEYFTAYMIPYMAAWDSATGDDSFTDNNYFRLMAHRTAYRWHKGIIIGAPRLQQTVTQLTGLYRDSDPQMAGLARWLVDQDSMGGYQSLETLVLADLAVEPIHPKDIDWMPLGKTLKGDDICHTRSSWEPNATCVQLFTRTMDSHRCEPEIGGLHIVRNGVPLIMRGRGRKGSDESLLTANVNIYPKGGRLETNNQGDSYWGGGHLKGPFALYPWVDRATSVIDTATQPSYRGILPTEDHGDDSHHVFAVDSMKFREMQMDPANELVQERMDVDKAKRTLVHLRPTDGREFIIVYDRIECSADYDHVWFSRYLNEPIASGNSWAAANDGQQISGQVLSPGMEVLVRGGPGKETEGPNGESYNGVGKVFYDAGSKYTQMQGAYAVFVRPTPALPKQDYCVVLEVGDAGFVPAAATMTGKVVSVGGWQIDFMVEDQTKVSR